MTITLTKNTTTIILPPDLVWADEAWSPVESNAERGLTGAQIIQIGIKQAARPITLVPPERGAWMPYASATTLATWRDTDPEGNLTLLLRGTTRTVRWRHHDTALTWEYLRHRTTPQAGDYVLPTLRLETV